MSFEFSPPVPLTRQTHIELQDPDEHLHRRRRPSQAASLRIPGLNRDEYFRRRENQERHEIQTMLPNYLYMHNREREIEEEEEKNARRRLDFSNVNVNEGPRDFEELPYSIVPQQAGEPDLEYYRRLQNIHEREDMENELGMPRAGSNMRPGSFRTIEQVERQGQRLIRQRRRERERQEREESQRRRRQLVIERYENLRNQYPPYAGESEQEYDNRIDTAYENRYRRSDLPRPPQRRRRRSRSRSSSMEQRIRVRSLKTGKRVSRRRSVRRSTKRISRRRSVRRSHRHNPNRSRKGKKVSQKQGDDILKKYIRRIFKREGVVPPPHIWKSPISGVQQRFSSRAKRIYNQVKKEFKSRRRY
jgi:hypothetical protein